MLIGKRLTLEPINVEVTGVGDGETEPGLVVLPVQGVVVTETMLKFNKIKTFMIFYQTCIYILKIELYSKSTKTYIFEILFWSTLLFILMTIYLFKFH